MRRRIHGLAMLAIVGAAASLSGQAPASSAPPGRALAPEDYYRMKSVGAPRISPDGQWVTFTVSVPVEATNGTTVETFLAAAAAARAPIRIQVEGDNPTNPRWGDDNRLRVTAKGATWIE